jgi:hypothetical protein
MEEGRERKGMIASTVFLLSSAGAGFRRVCLTSSIDGQADYQPRPWTPRIESF